MHTCPSAFLQGFKLSPTQFRTVTKFLVSGPRSQREPASTKSEEPTSTPPDLRLPESRVPISISPHLPYRPVLKLCLPAPLTCSPGSSVPPLTFLFLLHLLQISCLSEASPPHLIPPLVPRDLFELICPHPLALEMAALSTCLSDAVRMCPLTQLEPDS